MVCMPVQYSTEDCKYHNGYNVTNNYNRNNYELLINKADFNNLPIRYQLEVLKLSRAISAISDVEKERQLFEEFANKYTMHLDILKRWKVMERRNISLYDIPKLEERETFINIKASQHFYDETFLNFSYSDEYDFPVLDKVPSAFKPDHRFHANVDNFLREHRKTKAALRFPNPNLQEYWDYYQNNSLSPITAEMEERYQKLLKLSEKIQAHKDNPVQWIRCLQESGDHEFVVQNIEVAIAKMPYTKLAWKEYIAYLKRVDIMEMLNVYSRYCHFFVDDWKMREMYRLEIVKLCRKQINVQHWIDDYNYLNKELHIEIGYDSLLHYLVKTMITLKFQALVYRIKSCKFNLKHIPWKTVMNKKKDDVKENLDSDFPGFELHFVEYLIANANHRILSKLYYISKWFYKKRKVPLCYRLAICDNFKTISYEHSFFISPTNLDHDGLKNIYITNSIVVTSKDPCAFSKVKPRIFKCDPKLIKIDNQNLSFDEYCFLVNERNVEKIWFENVSVKWKSGEKVFVEFLIERLPKAKSMGFLRNAEIDLETSQKLAEIQLLNPLEVFSLGEIDETFEIKGFSEFVRNNGTSTSIYNIYFKPAVGSTFKTSFRRNLKSNVDHWFPRYALPQHKPQINIY